MVTVITADVIGSRQQGALMRQIPERLAALSHPMLWTAFSLSRGDEIQGVCRGVLAAPELVRRLRHCCRPLSLRIGIGAGPEPEDKADSSWVLSGEAFFDAREALERVKGARHARTLAALRDEGLDAVANAILALMDAIQSRWTAAQWEAVAAYESFGTYEAASKSLGIALQNVEKRCRAARWYAVRAGEAALRRLGEDYLVRRGGVYHP